MSPDRTAPAYNPGSPGCLCWSSPASPSSNSIPQSAVPPFAGGSPPNSSSLSTSSRHQSLLTHPHAGRTVDNTATTALVAAVILHLHKPSPLTAIPVQHVQYGRHQGQHCKQRQHCPNQFHRRGQPALHGVRQNQRPPWRLQQCQPCASQG